MRPYCFNKTLAIVIQSGAKVVFLQILSARPKFSIFHFPFRPCKNTIYILDEPTTGLHIADVHRLVDVLQMLVEGGNTVVVIEHNLDLIKTADHIIDLGPEGGDMGGEVIATGTPEQISKNEKSFTGQYLKPLLEK